MRIVFEIDESLTTAAFIEDVSRPSHAQAEALRDLCIEMAHHRDALLGRLDQS